MKMLSLGKFAALSAIALAGVAAAAPADAASSNWNASAKVPAIYQTNWTYNGASITSPSSVPSSARITRVNWSASLTSYPSGLTMYMTMPSGAVYKTTSMSGGHQHDGQRQGQHRSEIQHSRQQGDHAQDPHVWWHPEHERKLPVLIALFLTRSGTVQVPLRFFRSLEWTSGC